MVVAELAVAGVVGLCIAGAVVGKDYVRSCCGADNIIRNADELAAREAVIRMHASLEDEEEEDPPCNLCNPPQEGENAYAYDENGQLVQIIVEAPDVLATTENSETKTTVKTKGTTINNNRTQLHQEAVEEEKDNKFEGTLEINFTENIELDTLNGQLPRSQADHFGDYNNQKDTNQEEKKEDTSTGKTRTEKDINVDDTEKNNIVEDERVVSVTIKEKLDEVNLPLIWGRRLGMHGLPAAQKRVYSLVHPTFGTLKQLRVAQMSKLIARTPTGEQLLIRGKLCCNCHVGGHYTDYIGIPHKVHHRRRSRVVMQLVHTLRLEFPEPNNDTATRMAMRRFLALHIKAITMQASNPDFIANMTRESAVLYVIDEAITFAFIPQQSQISARRQAFTREACENQRRLDQDYKRLDLIARIRDMCLGLDPILDSVYRED